MTTFLEGRRPVHDSLRRMRSAHLAANKRRDTTALDVRACEWLCHALETECATKVLELGSGFSSWALRFWQVLHSEVEIWTVDDEAKWLETTRLELKMLAFRTDHLFDFSFLLTEYPHAQFDVVFVDLDGTATRVKHLDDFLRWTKPNGLIVFDDWHLPHYREAMLVALTSRGLVVHEAFESMDQFGRYLAWTRIPPTETA